MPQKKPLIETAKGTHRILVNIVNNGLYQDPKNYEGNNEGNNNATEKPQKKHYPKHSL